MIPARFHQALGHEGWWDVTESPGEGRDVLRTLMVSAAPDLAQVFDSPTVVVFALAIGWLVVRMLDCDELDWIGACRELEGVEFIDPGGWQPHGECEVMVVTRPAVAAAV
jgi:hypothetical protein